ncbi:hypothetical protein [Arthrobacter methylotrophus]|uniref:DUF4878 domain-containing protein n=1 Tax=Arthrobacter methylotrophus TaxID=121291 RepID=A0ABV5UPP0_9MICC
MAGGALGFFILQPAQGQSVPRATSGPVPAPVAEAVQSLPADPADYVSAQSPVRGSIAAAFPPGTTTTIVQDTWSQTVDNQGLVQVAITRPDKTKEVYAAMMVLEDGKWKVLATLPVQK